MFHHRFSNVEIYFSVTKGKTYVFIVILYVACLIYLSPSFYQVHMEGKDCVSGCVSIFSLSNHCQHKKSFFKTPQTRALLASCAGQQCCLCQTTTLWIPKVAMNALRIGLLHFWEFCLFRSYLWKNKAADIIYQTYSIVSFCVAYSIPCALFFVLYGKSLPGQVVDPRILKFFCENPH